MYNRKSNRERLLQTAAGSALIAAAPAAFAQSLPVVVEINGFSATDVDVSATSDLANEQLNSASNVSATAASSSGGNDIEVVFGSGSGALTMDGVTINSSNAITASAYSNLATNTINATTSPVFSESSAIASLQVNSSAVNGTSTSSQISAMGSGGTADILGTLTVDDNTISADANGNKATNRISIADNVSLASNTGSVTFGSGGPTISGTGATFLELSGGAGGLYAGSGASELSSTAQLAVSNFQSNIAAVTASATSDDIHITDVANVTGGAVSLAGNDITAAARGNEASSTVETGTGAADIDTTVAMSNVQLGRGALSAQATGADINSNVDTATGASIDVDDNTISARAYNNDVDQNLVLSANTVNAETGNRVTLYALENVASGGSGEALGVFAEGDLVISNLQVRDGWSTQATASNGDIRSQGNAGNTVVTGSNLSLDMNTIEAVALGSNADLNAVSIDANILGEGVGIASRQIDLSAAVTATTSNSEIISANAAITNSSVSVDDNTVRAVAASNLSNAEIRIDANEIVVDRIAQSDNGAFSTAYSREGSNGDRFVSGSTFETSNPLEAPYVSASLGVLNEQISSSNVTATLSSGSTIDLVGASVDTARLSVDGNNMVAAAYGNDAASSITVAPDATTGGSSSATALNDPLSPAEPTLGDGGDADVDNSTTGTGTSGTGTSGTGTSGTGTSGTGTSGSGTSGAGTTGPQDYANTIVASVVTRQEYTADVLAQVQADDDMIEIQVSDALDSALSVQDNRIEALAIANRTSENDVTFRALNIDTYDETGTLVSGSTSATLTALGGQIVQSSQAFSVIGAQDLSGDVTALATDTLVSGSGGVYDDLFIVGDVNGNVTTSTVDVDDNTIAATAQGNTGSNSLTLAAGARIQTTSSVINTQNITRSSLKTTLGSAGTEATRALDSTANGSFLIRDISAAGGGVLISADGTTVRMGVGDQLSIDIATLGLSPEDQASLASELTAIGFSGSGTTFTLGNDGSIASTLFFDFSAFVLSSPVNTWLSNRINFSGFSADAISFSPNLAGLILDATGQSITESTITILSNSLSGTVTGNMATNLLTATAISLNSSNTFGASVADSGNVFVADHVLINLQSVDTGTSLTSEVFGAFGLLQEADQIVSDSSIALTKNRQGSTGIANSATNTLSLFGLFRTDASSALASEQTSNSEVTAASDMELFANVDTNNSRLSLGSNVNEAIAIANLASNRVTLSSVTALSAQTATSSMVSSGTEVSADQVLSSNQKTADASRVIATASTTVFNNDFTDTTGVAITDSAVALTNNTTTAEATVNRVTNRMSLIGASAMDLSGALVNTQHADFDATSRSDQVRATASSFVVIAIDNEVSGASIDQSIATVNANRTTAMANGNIGTNVLNVEALKVEGLPATATYQSDFVNSGSVTAGYVLNSNQYNDSELFASATAQIGFALNTIGSAGGTAVDTAVLNVRGNQVAAQGIGNNASNTLSMASLHTSLASTSLSNTQYNTDPITTTVAGTSIGMAGGADWSASSITVMDNNIRATAIANSATNVMNRR